jgi:fermentation-respiration switch protein FrsA (DUF1100 family)
MTEGLKKIAFTVAGAYLALLMVMMALETRLVYPARDPARHSWQPTEFDYREFNCESRDGTNVHGWVLPGTKPGPAIVVFHGNAEDVAEVSPWLGESLRKNLDATILVFDYRGYGKTQGVPNEQRVLEDSEAAVRAFAKQLNTTPDKIVFYGRSLGGGVAVGTAERTGAGMLILDRTFNSLTETAASSFPWIPTSLIMRNRYPSDRRIAKLDIPLFQSHFEEDELIPFQQAEKLFAASPSRHKQFLGIPGGGHLRRLPDSWWPVAAEFVHQYAPVIPAPEK